MVYEKIDDLTAERIKPIRERIEELNKTIEIKQAQIKVEDSKRREAELRQEVKTHESERRKLYNDIEGIKTSTFEELLAIEYGVEDNPKFGKCFSLAWQHGHSSGFADVENYFSEFVELIK